jgi:hypothetical protein
MALGLRRRQKLPNWIQDPLWARAQRVPSLDLRFAANRSLRDAVTGRELVTFTRASNATVVGPTGLIETVANDVPRFQHDPLTGQCLGFLREEQRSNLLVRSEEFDNASWTKIRASVAANAIAAPIGATTADRLTEDNTATSTHLVQGAGTLTLGTTYTYSIYAKADTRRWLLLSPGGSWGYGWFDVQAGAVGTLVSGGSSATSSIQSVGNGWYRCTITATAVDTRTSIQVLLATGDNVVTYTGDGTSGLFLWGAQLEAGASPTSYIPTTDTSATRSADIATISTLGSSIRSLFAQVRGPASGTRGIIGLDDNSANNRIELLTSGTDPKLLVTTGGSAVADLDGGTVAANVEARLAARFAADNYAISVGGGAEVVDATGALPAVDRIRIGALQAGNTFSGTIARLTAWDQVLPNLRGVSQ